MIKPLKNKRLILVLLLAFTLKLSQAQQSKDSLGNYLITSIDTKSLVGYWQTTDSLKAKIEFIDSSWYQLILDLKNNSHPYYFIKDKQDTSKVSSSGFYPNWPPFDCDLNLIDSETLEIRLSQMGGPPYIIRCKKIRYIKAAATTKSTD